MFGKINLFVIVLIRTNFHLVDYFSFFLPVFFVEITRSSPIPLMLVCTRFHFTFSCVFNYIFNTCFSSIVHSINCFTR